MLAARETFEKINTLSDDNVAIVINLVDYLSAQQNKSNPPQAKKYDAFARDENMKLLADILTSQSEEDDDYVSDEVIDNALRIVFHLAYQPKIYKTFDNSIHMQFEAADRSYLEFEVFAGRATCMLVPQRDYDRAVYPEVSILSIADIKKFNEIVEAFYEGASA